MIQGSELATSEKFEILAADFEDGWAYVRHHDCVRLLRPPYQNCTVSVVSDENIADAILKHGFEEVNKTFEHIEELFSFLRQMLLKSRENRRSQPVDLDAPRKLLKYASESTVDRYLSQAEIDIATGDKRDSVFKKVSALLTLEMMARNDLLRERAIRILNTLKKEII